MIQKSTGWNMFSDKPLRVLVIDDEATLRHSIRSYLEDFDYEVLEAATGRIGLEIFTQHQPDIVLVDLRMPEVDGLEVIKKLTGDSPNTPVIVISGTGIIDDAVNALHLGAWDYLLKPIEDMTVLLHAVRQALERARLINENRKYQLHLEDQVAARTVELRMANEELEQINARLRQIVDTTKNLSFCAKLDELGSRLLEEFGRHMMATGGSMYLRKEEGLKLLHTLDPGHAPALIPFPLHEGSVFGRALKENRPILIQNLNSSQSVESSGWSGYKDGSLLVFPLPNEHGEVVGLLSLHSKIEPPFVKQDKEIGSILASYTSEALRATRSAEALAKSEERYRLLAENVTDNIWILDLVSQRLSYCSPSVKQITGFSPEEMMTMSLENMFTPDSFKTVVEALKEEFKGEAYGNLDPNRARDLELQQRHKNGGLVWVEVSARFLRGEEGTPIGLLGVTRDISERKELEAQFLQAQKMEVVGRLAGGIAHDFNNLLSPILAYSELLLLDLSQNDPRHGDLNEIQKAAIRAKELTRQLLAFGRKQVLEMKTVDLHRVVSDFERILRRTVREDIDLVFHLTPEVGRIKADVSQIEQVLMNLIVNGQDAMPQGGKMIIDVAEIVLDETYAESHEGVQPGWHVMLSVSDTGYGMDDETQEHVFEPFFTTKEKGEGTGLGLSTVYGIVKQHSGNIWIYSEPNMGTTFKIHFPRIDDVADGPSAAVEQRDSSAGGNESLLVVEDNMSVRKLVCGILKKHGYRIIEARNAKECLVSIERNKTSIQLLLTDVVMPETNGRDLYKKLVALLPDLKVIYMSGYTDDVIAHHGILEPGVDFIQKPISVHTLTTKIREVLDR
ncbi:MAG: response regulator [Deltaproteobacteria bacterium]|nr:response regulator [Deltaproteobacteria bacterium]